MSSKMNYFEIVCLLLLLLITSASLADDYYVIPFDVDPPITIDGKLDDWESVPNPISLTGKEHITFGGDEWSGEEDLGGKVHLAWRGGGIFIAADVIDDKVIQPYQGYDLWKGDHIIIWMDFTPGADPQRKMFGTGQFQVALSPGNLCLEPEIHLFRPEGIKEKGGQIISRKTDTGYIIEAYIPFAVLGVDSPKLNQDANFEVAFSDSDRLPARQETLATRIAESWDFSRDRLFPVVFGDGNGIGKAPVRSTMLIEKTTLESLKELPVTFTVGDIPEGKEPYIFFKARVNYPKPAGCVQKGLSLEVNGKAVDASRLANRKMSSLMMNGIDFQFVTEAGLITLCYTPTFEAVDKNLNYGLTDGTKACEFEFALGGLVNKGENTVVFKNLAQDTPKISRTIHFGDIAYRVRQKLEPPKPPEPPRPAPTGKISYIEPQQKFPKTYSALKQKGTQISFKLKGRTFVSDSRFTTPDGKWNTGSNKFYKHKRKIRQHDEWIEVRDTFKNLTDKDMPIMQEYSVELGKDAKNVWIAGLNMPTGNGSRSDSANPSVFAATENQGVGLLALNDEFIVHVTQSSKDGNISLQDRQFYLSPGKEYTAEWAIIPVADSDFWAFNNAARRVRDINFPLDICFAFMFHYLDEPVYDWSDEKIKNFIDQKGANFIVQSLYGVKTKLGYPARSTDWIAGPHDFYEDLKKRINSLYPDGSVKTGIYYHSFLDTHDENAVRFKGDRALDSEGNHINYGGRGAYMKSYVPSLEKGSWGEEMEKWLDIILDKIGSEVYWDEFSHAKVKYVYNKIDGCSADINPKTFKLQRIKGAVPLLSLPFRVKQVDRILDGGFKLIVNRPPLTRTMYNKKFPAFTETGRITNCLKTLLYSPIALGDHLTERNYADSYKTMQKALDYGCLYVWYSHIFHNHKAPTAYMYPFTPIELHSGYVIGKERIVTNRSGYFGWGDKSDFSPYVFDRDGKITDDVEIKKVTRKGKTYAEVRIGEGYYVILVRK